MRGEDRRSGSLFSYVDLEARVPAQHPLRAIREIVNASLAGLSAEFEALYSHTGRPGIAPERLLRALLLQAFYSLRSERRLMAELEFNLLYRWFVGLGLDDAAWDATVFCKNRDRLLAGDVAGRFLAVLLAQPKVKRLLSTEHFSVDGTLIATDGDARLYRKGRGKEARLSYLGHALMEWFGRLTMRPAWPGGRRLGQPGHRRGRAAGGHACGACWSWPRACPRARPEGLVGGGGGAIYHAPPVRAGTHHPKLSLRRRDARRKATAGSDRRRWGRAGAKVEGWRP